MELRHLRYFCSVVEHGSFTRAAEECSVAQPSLSQQIKNLEEELGELLLKRHPRRIELTEAGALLLEHARLILSEAESLEKTFKKRSAMVEGEVALGIIPTMAPYFVPDLVRRFGGDHPSVRIQIQEGRTSEQVNALVHGKIDFAITSDISPADRKRWSLHVREVFQENLMLAVPSSHRLAAHAGPLPLAQVPRDEIVLLSEGHCLSEQTLKVCKLRRSGDRLQCGQLETLLALVGAGLGVGFIPEMAARSVPSKNVKILRLRDPEPSRAICVVWRRPVSLTPAAETLLKYFTSLTQSLSANLPAPLAGTA